MPQLILGLIVLFLLIWALNGFAKADARLLARVLKPVGGIAALGLAVFLGLRGHLEVALPLGITGLGLLGWMPFGPAGFGARTQKRTGQTSRVRSAFVEMELDHDTGAMRGRVLGGPHQGRALDDFDVQTLVGLVGSLDEESRALLMAYLDRREPSWRQHAAGQGGDGGGDPRRGSRMTAEEAYQVLGLSPGAKPDDIARAHRALMKRLHPDQGGSTYLAARVNEAKDILLRGR